MRIIFYWSAIVFSSVLSTAIIAQPGTPDLSFGQDGHFQLDINNSQERINDMALFSNGDIVGVGVTDVNGNEEYVMVGITAGGNINADFGNEGIVMESNIPGDISEGVGVTIYNDKVYALVSSYNDTASYFQILKYNQLGELDASYADNGSFILDLVPNNFTPNDIYSDKDGNIYSSGERGKLICLIKLNDLGILDTSFGDEGVLVMDQGNRFERAIGISSQSDGKILMTGELNDPTSDWNLNVFRITTEGSLDLEFSGDGYIIENIRTGNTETGQDILQLKDGGILVTGGAHDGNKHQALFIKYMANGDRNTSFGDNGVVMIETGSNSPMESIAIDEKDRIVAAGEDVLLRLNSDGSLDTSFSDQGIMKDNFYSITAMELDEEGDILIAGSYWNGSNLDIIFTKFKSEASTAVIEDFKNFRIPVNVFPNPSLNHFNLEYNLEKAALVTISLYDVNGRKISQVLQEEQFPGHHKSLINIEKYENLGHVYFLRFQTTKGSKIVKLIKQ